MICNELDDIWMTACLLGLFADSKPLVDAEIKTTLHAIQDDFNVYKKVYNEKLCMVLNDHTLHAADNILPIKSASLISHEMRLDLSLLLDKHLIIPREINPYQCQAHKDIDEHILSLWGFFRRKPQLHKLDSTLIPSKSDYLVPGGRFNEFYYWDSYFISVGLLASGQVDLCLSLTNNIAEMIREYGYVPNGGRSYYLSRSQPPFFACMINMLHKANSSFDISHFINDLEQEYIFWITKRRYRKEGFLGQSLSIYSDSHSTPRPEAFLQDINTALRKSTKDAESSPEMSIYRDIRAAAESGWDFSSRWLEHKNNEWDISSIRTTQVVPYDLNCLLFIAENVLASHHPDHSSRIKYNSLAIKRKKILTSEPFWDPQKGWFYDCTYSRENKLHSTGIESLAASYSLFASLATCEQADAFANKLFKDFLVPGGVVTTRASSHSGQQWDYPNGWAPLQWITVIGLINYGYHDLAIEISSRFLARVQKVYEKTGYIMEKYDVVSSDATQAGSGGGEYRNQVGFGWTNGVFAGFRRIVSGDTAWVV